MVEDETKLKLYLTFSCTIKTSSTTVCFKYDLTSSQSTPRESRIKPKKINTKPFCMILTALFTSKQGQSMFLKKVVIIFFKIIVVFLASTNDDATPSSHLLLIAPLFTQNSLLSSGYCYEVPAKGVQVLFVSGHGKTLRSLKLYVLAKLTLRKRL